MILLLPFNAATCNNVIDLYLSIVPFLIIDGLIPKLFCQFLIASSYYIKI